MKTRLAYAFAAVALAAASTSVSADTSQIAASVGVDASDYTVTELARMKRNAETGGDDQVAIVAAAVAPQPSGRSQLIAAAGLTPAQASGMSLTALATAKANREVRGDDLHPIVSSRSSPANQAAWDQFAASAGLSAAEARGMSLHEIYLVKIATQSSDF